MNRLWVVPLALMMVLPLVAAGISCPCSRPGPEGTIVGFVCRNGTTENVTFYADVEAALGETYYFWALKGIDEALVPIENLVVTVKLDSEDIFNLTTDTEGYAEFTPLLAGAYEICGGDTNITFTLVDETEPIPLEVNETPVNETPEPEPEPEAKEEPEVVIKPPKKAPEGGFDPTLLIIAIAILIVVFILIKTKCCRQRKSSAISGRRRG